MAAEQLLTPPISYRDSTDMFFASRPTSTAYEGGAAAVADIVVDAKYSQVSGLEDHDRSPPPKSPNPSTTTSNSSTSSSSPLRQGLGSRLINASSSLTRSGTILHSRLKSSISYAAQRPSSSPDNTTTSPPHLSERPRQTSMKFLGGLFDGESAPVRLGLTPPSSVDLEKDTPEPTIMEHRTTFTPRPISSSRRQHSRKVSAAPSTASTSSPKSWFSRSTSTSVQQRPSPPTPSASSTQPDDLLTLNIHSALFPHGPPDPLDPSSFSDLLLNATNLLTRLQTAYIAKTAALAALQPEIEVQAEELYESQTRSEHLKLQLEGIGRECEEQRKVNEELVGQLARTRLEALEGRETIRLVRRSTAGSAHEIQRGKRRSAGSGSSVADSGFEEESSDDGEDGECCGSSVADSQSSSDGLRTPGSGSSPRLPPMVLLSSPEYDGQGWGGGEAEGRAVSMEAMRKEVEASGGIWGTVQSLRHENVDLKLRVESMRLELQNCIELVEGINMF